MACEIAVEKALGLGFGRRGIPDLEEPIEAFMNGYNLANDRIRNVYVALTKDDVHKEVFWEEFKVSASRRNAIMHKGAQATKDQAEASLKAAVDLVAHLKQ
jgi:hypothetical protein